MVRRGVGLVQAEYVSQPEHGGNHMVSDSGGCSVGALVAFSFDRHYQKGP